MNLIPRKRDTNLVPFKGLFDLQREMNELSRTSRLENGENETVSLKERGLPR